MARQLVLCLVLVAVGEGYQLRAHEGHQATTYEVTQAWTPTSTGRHLRLRIEDESGRPIAARFSLSVDGVPYVPSQLGPNGLRFVSIHKRLLSCGIIVPPVAGTDLPNFGFRDVWQPLFGEVRTYVHMRGGRGFAAWANAIRRGEVFITSGPLIRFTVNGLGAGSVLQLPNAGGEIDVFAELNSPRQLQSLEVIQMGEPVLDQPSRSAHNGITTYTIRSKLAISESCWIAARGTGGPKTAIEQGLGIKQNEIAHTGVIRVIVGDRPIRNPTEVDQLRKRLVQQQEYYRSDGRYKTSNDRARFMKLFEQAIKNIGSGVQPDHRSSTSRLQR